jgi:hypothetical protein
VQAWQVLQPEIDRLAPIEFERGLGALTAAEQRLLLVWSYIGAIDNGGHASLIYNSYGDHWRETIDALDAIGAKAHADNLRTLGSAFAGGAVPREQNAREHALAAMSDANQRCLVDCDERFYLQGSERLMDLLLADWCRHEA